MTTSRPAVNQPPSTDLDAGTSFNLGWIWTISLVAALGGLLFGYDWVVIGGAKPFYESLLPPGDGRRRWAGR